MEYFENVKTIEELRKRYRELLKVYHPDNKNGSLEITKEINKEYDILFTRLNNKNEIKYTQEDDEEFRIILNEIINFNMTVEIIGSWIWCFDCYQYKDKLKELGFKWCSKKKAWTWHSSSYKSKRHKEIDIEMIRLKYGSKTIKKQSKNESLKLKGVI